MLYESNEKYIFVSYAHKDSHKVLPLIELMSNQGFRLWYDEGIEAGTEWPAFIEEQLEKSHVVLAFMTPATVESKHCRNEINMALDLGKEVLVVYLEDTKLWKGMRLQLSFSQSLYRSRHKNDETFVEQLINARIIQCCREGFTAESDSFSDNEKEKPQKAMIANILSVGSNDSTDAFPKHLYTQFIDRDKYSVMFFHIYLFKPIGFEGTANINLQIFNSNDNLVFVNDFDVDVNVSTNILSTGWIIKGSDSSFIPSGEYRLICSVENSAVFTYCFTIYSESEPKSIPSDKKTFLKKVKEWLSH